MLVLIANLTFFAGVALLAFSLFGSWMGAKQARAVMDHFISGEQEGPSDEALAPSFLEGAWEEAFNHRYASNRFAVGALAAFGLSWASFTLNLGA